MQASPITTTTAKSMELNSSIKSGNATPTPVALRTRSQLETTYSEAAQTGKCKLCPTTFVTPPTSSPKTGALPELLDPLENRLLPPDILDLVEDLICKTCHLNQDPPSILKM
ncbi:hypothetical protein NPIL_694591 [Nephila pilipes]|uniref:Uncharacterized protein n=1 Tax=Nephila pilipes TaxID=299642 RepID=A0A8X6IKX9_NEPPI|nr:hypothetical protein NPIL_694591 [Nephila pilipes]